MGLTVSWERWDAGSMPVPAQWVKGPSLQKVVEKLRDQRGIGAEPGPGNFICLRVAKKKKKKKKKKRKVD